MLHYRIVGFKNDIEGKDGAPSHRLLSENLSQKQLMGDKDKRGKDGPGRYLSSLGRMRRGIIRGCGRRTQNQSWRESQNKAVHAELEDLGRRNEEGKKAGEGREGEASTM